MDVELLALRTGESLAVYRLGPFVLKLLKPLDKFRVFPYSQTPATRLAELVARARISFEHFAALDPASSRLIVVPHVYLVELNVIVSLYVPGRKATREEMKEAVALLKGRKIQDVHRGNLIVYAGRLFLIDFRLPRWFATPQSLASSRVARTTTP